MDNQGLGFFGGSFSGTSHPNNQGLAVVDLVKGVSEKFKSHRKTEAYVVLHTTPGTSLRFE